MCLTPYVWVVVANPRKQVIESNKDIVHRNRKKLLPTFKKLILIIKVLIGGLLGYMLAWGIGGGMIPRRREEKRKREERARGMKHMASDLGTLGYCIPKLMESRAHQSASLVPLCFAQKQAAGIDERPE